MGLVRRQSLTAAALVPELEQLSEFPALMETQRRFEVSSRGVSCDSVVPGTRLRLLQSPNDGLSGGRAVLREGQIGELVTG